MFLLCRYLRGFCFPLFLLKLWKGCRVHSIFPHNPAFFPVCVFLSIAQMRIHRQPNVSVCIFPDGMRFRVFHFISGKCGELHADHIHFLPYAALMGLCYNKKDFLYKKLTVSCTQNRIDTPIRLCYNYDITKATR